LTEPLPNFNRVQPIRPQLSELRLDYSREKETLEEP
jgi:hypothetical protein